MIEFSLMFELSEAKAQQFQGRLMMVTPVTDGEKEELRQLLLARATEASFDRIRELIGRAIFIDQKCDPRRMN